MIKEFTVVEMKKILVLLWCSIVFTISFNFISDPALALLREHHQSPGVLRYHAQHSIKDKQQRAWQVILFPEDRGSTVSKYYLRLVGFPDLVEFMHPRPLEIVTSKGNVLIAPDTFADATPSPNVGQYEVTDILSQLTNEGSLKLIFSLLQSDRKALDAVRAAPRRGQNRSVRDVTLKITPAMIAEWQMLERSPVFTNR